MLTRLSRFLPCLFVGAALAFGALITACGGPDESSGEPAADDRDRVNVVATTPVVADLVASVGGDAVEISTVVEAGADPHEFELQPGDVTAAAEAELVFASGLGIDHWVQDMVAASGESAELVILAEHLPERARDRAQADPHWWHDPRNAVVAVREIGSRLAEADPEHAARHRQEARQYAQRIAQLDARIDRCLSRLSESERSLVTDHRVFGHFADRYELDVIGTVIPSLDSQSQPSAREISELAARMESEGVKVAFPDRAMDPELAGTLANQLGVALGSPLYGDSLGAEGSAGDSYIGMLSENAAALAEGLSGGRLNCEELKAAG